MSYLGLPRLTFSGTFLADPSTVNNDPEHFDSANFQPSYQLPSQGGNPNGWWNPNGTGAFRLQDCRVTGVVYGDGTICNDPATDAFVGSSITDDASNVEAKLVDLDSEHQMTSQIWGLKVFAGNTVGGLGFSGDFAVASFIDLFQPFTNGQGDSALGAGFQSVLGPIQWAGAGTSRFLRELSERGTPARLSMKFNVQGYNDDSTSPGFTLGKIVGSIGPQANEEPSFFVAGRVLDPTPGSSLNSAYAELAGDRLTVDLGNSLNTQSPGGPLIDLGILNVVILPPGQGQIVIGAVPYKTPDWYAKTAGIVSFVLTPAQVQAAASAPLALIASTAPANLLLAESPDGIWVRADATVFRLNPGDTGETTIYATRFGSRLGGVPISLGYDASIMRNQTTQGPIPGPLTVGQPKAALTFPPTVTTAANGTAVILINSADPGNPRGYIDGQLYGVSYQVGNVPPPIGSVMNASRILNALVWSRFNAPVAPTWSHDIQPILQQYANLYPVMKQYFDMADYNSVVAMAGLIQQLLSVPMTDPSYMPVTRDLSDPKRTMILQWLANPLP